MRDNDHKKDSKFPPLPKLEPVLLPEETYFDYYIQESEAFRLVYGISKVQGKFVITDLDRIKKLPEWQKDKLRALIRNG